MTEELLKPAEADVLEIFDWQVRTLHLKAIHANTRSKLLCRKSGADQGRQQVSCIFSSDVAMLMTLRLFEYLAATKKMASTKVPGDDSFTSALIHALEALVMEKAEGRFTTVELLRKINHDAPHFPKKSGACAFRSKRKYLGWSNYASPTLEGRLNGSNTSDR